jgi:hypothetical protein
LPDYDPEEAVEWRDRAIRWQKHLRQIEKDGTRYEGEGKRKPKLSDTIL